MSNPERFANPPQPEGTATILRQLVARIRQIDAQTVANSARLRDVYSEAKARGISTKSLKAVARNKDAAAEADEVKQYLAACGAPRVVVDRLDVADFDTVLFGSADRWPSNGIDL